MSEQASSQLSCIDLFFVIFSDQKIRKIILKHPLWNLSNRRASCSVIFHVSEPGRIYNKILDRDWFSARLFATSSARDHVSVQLQVSNYNFFFSNWIPVIGYLRHLHVSWVCFNGLSKALLPFSFKRSFEKTF